MYVDNMSYIHDSRSCPQALSCCLALLDFCANAKADFYLANATPEESEAAAIAHDMDSQIQNLLMIYQVDSTTSGRRF